MRLAFISHHFPLPDGSSAGKSLWAVCQGLIDLGHEVEVVSWRVTPPPEPLPSWCVWRPPAPEARLVTRARALVHPRWDSTRSDWRPDSDVIAIADDTESFAAVAGSSRSVATFHYLNRLDMRARPRRLADLQWMRAERYTARKARLVTTYSERVARVVGHGARVVPIGYPVPAAPVLPLRDPVAGMIADWRWAPNRPALEHLLRGWPHVRGGLPDARLVLAGNGSDLLGTALPDGVDLLGPVPKIDEFWEQVGLLAFPAVATSGPKVKVLEALAFGVPVVTTEWGVEGLAPAARRSVVVTTPPEFARVCLEVLADPDRRAALGAAGRQAVLDAHAPAPAAKARAAVLADAFRVG